MNKVKYESVEVKKKSVTSGLAKAVRGCPVGKSFLWEHNGSATNFLSHRNYAYLIAKKCGYKISTSTEDENHIRIWRHS